MQQSSLNDVFSALADPTRRKIIEILREKDCTVLELSDTFDISLPAVSKHLRVLENALLLKREKNGRYVICHYNPQPLKDAVQWLSHHYDFWNEGFDSLEKILNTKAQERKKQGAE